MTKKTAEQKGYIFTGIYSHDKDTVKTRAEEIRAKGYDACMVSIPSNPLSRGYSSTGYSVYAEPKFSLDIHAASVRRKLKEHAANVESENRRHTEELASLEQQRQNWIKWLTDNNYQIC